MLSFLHRLDYCSLKCDFDSHGNTEFKITHHDGEQLGIYQKEHIKTQSKMKVLF